MNEPAKKPAWERPSLLVLTASLLACIIMLALANLKVPMNKNELPEIISEANRMVIRDYDLSIYHVVINQRFTGDNPTSVSLKAFLHENFLGVSADRTEDHCFSKSGKTLAIRLRFARDAIQAVDMSGVAASPEAAAAWSKLVRSKLPNLTISQKP